MNDSVKHKPLAFSGIQPSGKLHLGNYLGAMKNWVRKMAGLVASRNLNSSQMTDLQKVDFLVETLSLGVGSNVSCYFDWLKWPVSDSLRATLQTQFGDNALRSKCDEDMFTIG